MLATILNHENEIKLLKEIKLEIVIVTNNYYNNDYKKYKQQYNNIKMIINNNFHDRFIILGKKVLYHCGASLKDLGMKCFAINKINNEKWIEELLNNIKV